MGVVFAFYVWKVLKGYRFHYPCARCGKPVDPRAHAVYHTGCEP